MQEPRRLAYLSALGIEVWRERMRADDPEPAAQEQVQPALPAECTDGLPCAQDELGALDLDALRTTVSQCTKCDLHATRHKTVFGEGHAKAEMMIVGEAPGADEDRAGQPFVGKAGQLLTQMLRAIGLSREEVFICNILKCRPPNNRDPSVEETSACCGFLNRQIELVGPRIILAVGRIAAQSLLAVDTPVGKLRGRIHYLQESGCAVIVTYHPAYLLRSPKEKAKSWQDLKLARKTLLDALQVAQ